MRRNVVLIAKELLGKILVTNMEGKITSGMIVETEAYEGIIDKASHAYGNRRTNRTETMYESGGTAYVYLCYGIHHLFNVVTNIEDLPHAVLIRAVEPIEGVETMMKRRNKKKQEPTLTSGPGSLSEALGIHKMHNGLSLSGEQIWIEDRGIKIRKSQIISSPRVGVSYAGSHALWPYRFRIKDNAWVSKAK